MLQPAGRPSWFSTKFYRAILCAQATQRNVVGVIWQIGAAGTPGTLTSDSQDFCPPLDSFLLLLSALPRLQNLRSRVSSLRVPPLLAHYLPIAQHSSHLHMSLPLLRVGSGPLASESRNANLPPATPLFSLPPELLIHILHILRHAPSAALAASVAHLILSPHGSSAALLALSLPPQAHLARLALVSYAWCAAARAVLYAAPVLPTTSRLHDFTDTLRAQPTLFAPLVRSLALLDNPPEELPFRIGHLTDHTLSRQRVHHDLLFLFATCPALRNGGGYHAHFARRRDTVFSMVVLKRRVVYEVEARLLDGLACITCDGFYTFHDAGAALRAGRLSRVRELVLRKVDVGSMRSVALPRLTDITIEQCHYDADALVHLLPEDAPALRRATLVENRIHHKAVPLAFAGFPLGLGEVTLVGDLEWIAFESCDWTGHTMLKQMSLRLAAPPSGKTLPPALEVVTMASLLYRVDVLVGYSVEQAEAWVQKNNIGRSTWECVTVKVEEVDARDEEGKIVRLWSSLFESGAAAAIW